MAFKIKFDLLNKKTPPDMVKICPNIKGSNQISMKTNYIWEYKNVNKTLVCGALFIERNFSVFSI